MKKLRQGRSLLILLLIANTINATTYYSKINGNANTIGGWGLNSDGSGSNPLNFVTAGDVFKLNAGSSLGLSGNWTIGSGVTLEVYGEINVTTNNRDITIDGTVVFYATNSTQVFLTGGGNGNNFTVSAGAILKTANLNGIRGNNCSLPSNASGIISLSSSATYEFIGSGNQNITGSPATIANLVIDNNAGVTLGSSVTVTNSIDLINGILAISTGNTLTLSSANAILGTGFGNNKHISTGSNGSSQGFLRVNSITGTYLFPVGNGSMYLPATVVTAASSDIRINAFTGLTVDGTPAGNAFTSSQKQNAVDAVWRIDRLIGSGSILISMGWDQSLEGAAFSVLGNTEIGIARNSGSSWEAPMGAGSQFLNTATRSGLSSGGIFAVGKGGIPLPLKFGTLSLEHINTAVNVKWVSLTEMNVHHYTVERSSDGRDYHDLGSITAATNNYSRNDYEWMDISPLAGNSFYRIRASDIDGRATYSSVARYNAVSDSKNKLNIFPNPVIDKKITVQFEAVHPGSYQLSVFTTGGNKVYEQQIANNGGTTSQQFILPSSTAKGTYVIRISNGESQYTKTVYVN
jgi:hypothetical protein